MGALNLIYVRDWKDGSIGATKKELRMELGQKSNMNLDQEDTTQPDTKWSDIDAVRHINVFGTPTQPLMEIAYVQLKEDKVREFFEAQGVEVCYHKLKPCIDPAILETKDTDNRKIALRLNHFVRILLARWKAANYVYSPDTRRLSLRK